MKWSYEWNLPILVYFSWLIPKMSMFTLAISYMTSSNLPWFMGLTFQVPMQYCSLQHRTSTTRHIHSWALFPLWLSLFIPSGAISPHFSSSKLGIYWPAELIYPVISFCLFVLFTRFSKQKYWDGLPFPFPVNHILLRYESNLLVHWQMSG